MSRSETLEALGLLLARRPPVAAEICVANRRRRQSVGSSVGRFVVDEVLFSVLGGEPGGSDESPRVVTVAWVASTGPLGGIALAPDQVSGDVHREVLVAARREGVPVRYLHEDEELVGSTIRHVGFVGGPRPAATPGKLAPLAKVLDVAGRFEVEVRRIDRPGMVGRKVLRRSPVEEVFRVVMDEQQITVDHVRRSDPVHIEIPRADLLGIANARRSPLAITREGSYPLPTIDGWSRVDFRGRDLAAWAYERILDRSGL